jgi:hypothetical protein
MLKQRQNFELMIPNEVRSTTNPSNEMTKETQTFYQTQLLNHIKAWLLTYAESTSGVEMLADATVEFDDGSQEAVDALLRVRTDAGGQSRVEDSRVEGAPELIVQRFDGVSPATVYRRQVEYFEKGVAESIIVDREGTAPWHSPGDYTLHDGENIVSGTTFPGLKLNIKYFYEDDLSAQCTQLEDRLGSGIHCCYEEQLGANG